MGLSQCRQANITVILANEALNIMEVIFCTLGFLMRKAREKGRQMEKGKRIERGKNREKRERRGERTSAYRMHIEASFHGHRRLKVPT
ncbi:hypothetical protein ALC60_09256 [Trachymyrmex zeteki]|uniref:Uncharacterized protein n=1 Tax=Mycetomoellerius zeteki TaxID=64791 RepID=A0A151WV51_9HYME|nr:hypothetical protein ALC60_09256 [Trachymyrmex zeteki]